MTTGTQFTGCPQVPARFEIRGELGRGGMAVVFHAYDVVGERDVALKFLPPTENVELRKRFQREANDLAAVFHPNIVEFYALGECQGHEFIEMEFVDGGNLASFTASCESLRGLLEVFIKICDGLEHIHRSGVVHRDIKPANILMTRDNQPKISDLGLARREDGRSQLTQDGALLGTASYLAPEQLMSHAVGPSADLYALGVCLFEAVTCRHPFNASGPMAMLRAHLDEQPPTPSSVLPGLPERLDRLILGLLEKDPANRPGSALQVLGELQACLIELSPAQELLVASSPDGILNRARLMLEDGKTGEAMILLDIAEARTGGDEAARARILCLKAKGKVQVSHPQALAEAQRAVEACRGGQIKLLGEALLVLGRAATQGQHWDQALQALQEARDLIPSNRRELQVGLMESLAALHEQGASLGHPSLSGDESRRFRELAQSLAKREESLNLAARNSASSLSEVSPLSLPPASGVTLAPALPFASKLMSAPALPTASEVTPASALPPTSVVVGGGEPKSAPPRPRQARPGLLPAGVLFALLLTGGLAYLWWPQKLSTLEIAAEPQGAVVMIDEQRFTSPHTAELKAGSYQVKIFQQGFKAHEEKIVLEPGQSLKLQTHLQAASGALHLVSTPVGAKLFVNGQARGTTPANLDGLPPKTFQLKLVKEGYKTYSDSVEVQAGKTKNLAFSMTKLPAQTAAVPARTPTYSGGTRTSTRSSSSYPRPSPPPRAASTTARSPKAKPPKATSVRSSGGRVSLPRVNIPTRVEVRLPKVRFKHR